MAVVAKLGFAADDVIPRFVIPEAAFALELLVDGAGAEAFDGVHQVLQAVAGMGADEGVDVVGHDDGGAKIEPGAVKVLEGVRNVPAEGGIAQEAGAIAAIEQSVPADVEDFGVFVADCIPLVRHFSGRGDATGEQPIEAVGLQFPEAVGGEGIREAEGDEIRGAGLLPVGEMTLVDGGRLARIIGLEGHGRGRKC